jgi:hypothetical protein
MTIRGAEKLHFWCLTGIVFRHKHRQGVARKIAGDSTIGMECRQPNLFSDGNLGSTLSTETLPGHE